HSEASFDPEGRTSAKLTDNPDYLDDLATFYRHPQAVDQLRILNESDIRSINQTSSYWTPQVKEELDKVSSLLKDRVSQLNVHSLPILTTELPDRFDLLA